MKFMPRSTARCNARKDSGDSTNKAREYRFDEELQQNNSPRRAKGLSHADFARSFGDGHQHDVHDADASNDKADGCDAGEKVCQDPGRVGGRYEEIRLVSNTKVVGSVRRDAVLTS